jgi:hypothetical protein
MKIATSEPPPEMPEATIRFALPKPWPKMTEEERETFVHEWYVALTQRAPTRTP